MIEPYSLASYLGTTLATRLSLRACLHVYARARVYMRAPAYVCLLYVLGEAKIACGWQRMRSAFLTGRPQKLPLPRYTVTKPSVRSAAEHRF